jgi:hypothetical protein
LLSHPALPYMALSTISARNIPGHSPGVRGVMESCQDCQNQDQTGQDWAWMDSGCLVKAKGGLGSVEGTLAPVTQAQHCAMSCAPGCP